MNLANPSQVARPTRCIGIDGYRRSWRRIEKIIAKRLADRASHDFLSAVELNITSHCTRYIEPDRSKIYSDSTEYDGSPRRHERDVLGLTIFKAWREECEFGRVGAFDRHFSVQRQSRFQHENEL